MMAPMLLRRSLVCPVYRYGRLFRPAARRESNYVQFIGTDRPRPLGVRKSPAAWRTVYRGGGATTMGRPPETGQLCPVYR